MHAFWKKPFKPFLGSLFAGLLAISAMPASAQSPIDDLTFMTEDYPPFNFKEDGKLRGVSTEIVVELFKRTGSKKTLEDIQLISWARGYKLTQEEPNNALYSTTRTESREKLFKWVGPFVPTVIGLIAKKERSFDIKSIEDVYKLRVGTVKDDIGHLLLEEAGMPAKRLEPVLYNEQNYKKLFADRIDAIAYEANVSTWRFKKLGKDPSQFEVIHELKRSDLYLALHKDTPDTIVELLQSELNKMKADGTYNAILAKYMN